VALSALEIFLAYSYERAEMPPAPFRALFRQYYNEYERQTIQAIPECARHDPAVAHTLRPGQCEFSGRESSTTVRANSAGFRDDETSLSPMILVASDSFTMGWGVEQEESYAQNLEVLVIQYHPNDFKENRTYAEFGDSLPITPKEDLDETHYYPWDGHLTPEGHAVVASLLADALGRPAAPDRRPR
jgi:hypothetical protein